MSKEFVAYPRGPELPGSVEQLKQLVSGYFLISWVSALNLIWIIGYFYFFLRSTDNSAWAFQPTGFAVATMLLVGFASFPGVRKIGYGMGWKSWRTLLATALTGLNAPLAFGMIVYIGLYVIVVKRTRAFGVKRGFLGGIERRHIKEAMARLSSLRPEPNGLPPVL